MVKSTCHSCKGPELTTTCGSSSVGIPTLTHIPTLPTSTRIHRIKILKKTWLEAEIFATTGQVWVLGGSPKLAMVQDKIPTVRGTPIATGPAVGSLLEEPGSPEGARSHRQYRPYVVPIYVYF